jgi:cobalt/nickel transport protein
MKKNLSLALSFAIFAISVSELSAHFMELIPSQDIVNEISGPIVLKAVFTHPMENGPVMNMDKPKDFGVIVQGKKKSIVDVFDSGEGGDEMAGLPVEIEPLARPFALWTGNCFRGIAKKNGIAIPFAEIEVEYVNEDGKIKIPAPQFTTQIIKADQSGVFSYTMPKAGWWGFAVLCEGDRKMKNPEGEDVDVELGGLIWIKTTDMK